MINDNLTGDKRKKDAPPSTMEASLNAANSTKNNNTSNKSKSQGNENTKKRNWAFIVYPTKEQLSVLNSEYDGSDGYGSVPDDWQEQLQLSGLQYAISPLHDKDKLEDGSGKMKKPHYHVISIYGSPTTYNNVKRLTDSLNAPIPQALEQVRGYYRYLTHKDNADKYQYDEKDIITGGGFNIINFVELTKSESLKIKKELHLIIREHSISEYIDLLDYAMFNLSDFHYDVVASNTMLFGTAIKSLRYKLQRVQQGEKLIDFATGELICKNKNENENVQT